MEWINVKDQKPEDDKNYIVIHERAHMNGVKAYWCEEEQLFYCIECVPSIPVAVTHYMEMPSYPKDEYGK